MSDFCLKPNKQYYRWWWCPLYTRLHA